MAVLNLKGHVYFSPQSGREVRAGTQGRAGALLAPHGCPAFLWHPLWAGPFHNPQSRKCLTGRPTGDSSLCQDGSKSTKTPLLWLLLSPLLLRYHYDHHFIRTVTAFVITNSGIIAVAIFTTMDFYVSIAQGDIVHTKLRLCPQSHLQSLGAWLQNVGFTEWL